MERLTGLDPSQTTKRKAFTKLKKVASEKLVKRLDPLTQARAFRQLVGQDGDFPKAPFDLSSAPKQRSIQRRGPDGGGGQRGIYYSFTDEPFLYQKDL